MSVNKEMIHELIYYTLSSVKAKGLFKWRLIYWFDKIIRKSWQTLLCVYMRPRWFQFTQCRLYEHQVRRGNKREHDSTAV